MVTLEIKTNNKKAPKESYLVDIYYTNKYIIDKTKHAFEKDIEVLDRSMPMEYQKLIPRHGKKFIPDIGTELYSGDIMKECT